MAPRPNISAMAVAPDPEPGGIVGPYALLDVLGQGGAGTVFKARHVDSGRVVALKVLAASKVKRARIVQRFFDEVRAASAADHPGLVDVYDFIEEDEPRRLAYAMEFVDGEPLRRRLRRDGALDLRTAIAVGGQICDALGALHQAGIIHRDLKPENVLLVDVAGKPKAKLLDYGVVKFLPVDRTEKVETSTAGSGTFVGTPRYMAPEQAAGAAVDHRADLFALGVVLFEMITGECPHEGDSLRDVVLAKLKGARRITVNPEQEILPQELTEVVDACLRLKPSERPESADRVGAVLAEAELVLFAVGRPVRADSAVPAFYHADEPAPLPPAAPVMRASSAPSVAQSASVTPTESEPVAPTAPAAPTVEMSSPPPRSTMRVAMLVLALVGLAMAVALSARVLTQQDSVLVLPEPDPPASRP